MEGKSIPSWQKENTGVLAKKLDFAASIICKRCYKYLSNGIYYFQSQNNGDLAKKIYFDAGIICQICYNVFFQVITYICHSIFQYFQSLNNGDLAKKFDFAAGSFHPISWSCLCHSRSLDHAQVFLPLVQARHCNITVFCDKNGARMFKNHNNKNTTLYQVYNSPKASQGSAGGSTDFFLLQKSDRGHIFQW